MEQQCDTKTCWSAPVSSPILWGSTDTTIVTVLGGIVHAVGRGTAYVTASAGVAVASAEIRVGSAHIPLTAIGSGGRCALTASGAAYCWGDIQLDSPDPRYDSYTARSLTGGLSFTAIAVGSAAMCGIAGDDQGYCWGTGSLGGTGPDTGQPVPIAGGIRFRSLSAGKRDTDSDAQTHGCGVAIDGVAWCWGANDAGQLGTDSILGTCHNVVRDQEYPCSGIPVRVAGGLALVSISAGGQHTCALAADGTAYCWGDNTWGQLGDSSTVSRAQPVAVRNTPAFTAIVAGIDHTCGLSSTGEAWCWGRNARGELGRGESDGQPHPVPALVAGNETFVSLDAAGTTCGLTPSGQALCWGVTVIAPRLAAAGMTFRSIGAFARYSYFYDNTIQYDGGCGVALDDRVYCWEGRLPPFPIEGPVQP